MSENINCEDGEVKWKLDSILYEPNYIHFKNGVLSTEYEIDDKSINNILQDAKLKDILRENPIVYIPFNFFKPYSSFYCD